MIVYDVDKRCWNTYYFEDMRKILELREKLRAVMLLTAYFHEELQQQPCTHYEHDRLIRKLRKLANLLEKIHIFKEEFGKNRPVIFYWREIRDLRNFAEILNAYRDCVKRERLYVLRFIYPHIMATIEKTLEFKVEFILGNNAKFEYHLWVNPYAKEVHEWVYFELRHKGCWRGERKELRDLELILNKMEERKQRKNKYILPISIKELFEVWGK